MIEDELLRGKAPTLSDLADLLALLSHPRVGETLGGVRSEPAVRQVITRWARLWTVRNLGPWLFRYGETDALIGYAGLAPAPESVEPDSVELLYALRPEFWGRGFATRMSSLALRHAFPTCSTAWPAPADSAATCRVGPSLRCGLRTSRARAKETAIKLQVKVVPGSSRNDIAGWLGESLKVRVSAPAERGRANAAVEATLAEALGVAMDRVRVVGGKTSPRKVVEVSGLSEADVHSRLSKGV